MRLKYTSTLAILCALFSAASFSSAAGADGAKEICMTEATFKRLTSLPVKAGCLVPSSGGRYCAFPSCIGQVSEGDFDRDGKTDSSFSLQMSEKFEEDYWVVFASLSAYNTVLRVSSDIHLNPATKNQVRTESLGDAEFQSRKWAVHIGDTANTESFGFDLAKKKFVPLDDLESAPPAANPGIGLSLLGGTSATYTSTALSSSYSFLPWIGFQGAARVDFYPLRWMSVESGIAWTQLSYKMSVMGLSGTTVVSGGVTTTMNALQIPLQLKFWPIPAISLGGGIVYSKALGQIGCSDATGSVYCTQSGIDYASSGLKTSYVSWIVSGGFKARIGKSAFWWVGELELIGTPNLVQNAVTVGTSSFSFKEFQSYGGLRYGFLAR